MARHPLIRIQKLGVHRNRRILHNIDWQVDAGQHWVLLGSNGSGKTSLLRALTAYLTPSCGVIQVCGKTYGESPWQELRRHIGMVSSAVQQQIEPGETALAAIVSGRHAVINHSGPIRASERHQALAILRRMNCEPLADRPWLFLSQGERQKILIGRALMARLKILILDEPCAGLDPVAREKFLNFLPRLARQKNCPALVLVTHHVEEIGHCFTHALLLARGSVIDSGPLDATLTTANLKKIFGRRVLLKKDRQRYRLLVNPGRSPIL